ncbi:MAG: DegV family protein [Anaerolineales bacterium]
MTAFHVLTDSNCHIPPALCTELGIRVVPLPYVWGGQAFSDGVDIPPKQFYRRLRGARDLPKTSGPTPGAFIGAMRELNADGKPVLGIFVGSEFSSTVASAKLALEEIGKERGTILDSKSNALGMGFQVLAAARAAKEGATLEEAIRIVERAGPHCGVVFAVSDLGHLRKGGRIGFAQSLLGSALKTIPILAIDQGPIAPVGRTRSKAKAINELLDQVEMRLDGDRPYRLGVLHSDAEDVAWELRRAAEARFQPDEMLLEQLNSILAIHVGPDAFGLAYCSGV